MAKKLFIAATGRNCGKTTASLALFHLARQHYRRVGFIKPLGPKATNYRGRRVDKDAALVCRVFGLGSQLKHMSPVVIEPDSTRRALDGELDCRQLEEQILHACAALEELCDFIIIEGSGHPGVGSVMHLSNARIASLLQAPVLMVTGGGIGNVIDAVHINKALFEREGVEVRAILANKLLASKRDSILDYLHKALTREGLAVLGGFNYQPVLADPTLNRIATILDLEIHGSRRENRRIIHNVQIGAPSTQRVTELLKKDTLLIVTSSRDELLVTLSNLYQIPEYRQKIVGLLIPGVQNISAITEQIIERSKIPFLRTTCHTSGRLYQIISEDVYKLQAEDREKLDMIWELAEKRLDFGALDQIFS